jgi:putative FmdB family regulatory protein
VPIYEFRCPNGHTFEIFQRMSDAPPTTCEVCGAGPVEKMLFPVAVHFKGKGFYSTDYGRASRAGGAKDSDTSSSSSGSGSSSSESGGEKKKASGGESSGGSGGGDSSSSSSSSD